MAYWAARTKHNTSKKSFLFSLALIARGLPIIFMTNKTMGYKMPHNSGLNSALFASPLKITRPNKPQLFSHLH
jgi:hypothetical protein